MLWNYNEFIVAVKDNRETEPTMKKYKMKLFKVYNLAKILSALIKRKTAEEFSAAEVRDKWSWQLPIRIQGVKHWW